MNEAHGLIDAAFGPWAGRHKAALDKIVADVASPKLVGQADSVLRSATRELAKLETGVEPRCDYDVSGVAALYALFYHGKRVHDAIWHLARTLPQFEIGTETRFIDIGSGTGAVAWAVALLRHYLVGKNVHLAERHITCCEPSPAMNACRSALWAALDERLLRGGVNILLSQHVQTWEELISSGPSPAPSVVIGSFPFSRGHCWTAPETAAALRDTLARVRARGVVLWTSKNKGPVLFPCIRSELEAVGWEATDSHARAVRSGFWAGDMDACAVIAAHVHEYAPSKSPLSKAPSWGGRVPYPALIMRRKP